MYQINLMHINAVVKNVTADVMTSEIKEYLETELLGANWADYGSVICTPKTKTVECHIQLTIAITERSRKEFILWLTNNEFWDTLELEAVAGGGPELTLLYPAEKYRYSRTRSVVSMHYLEEDLFNWMVTRIKDNDKIPYEARVDVAELLWEAIMLQHGAHHLAIYVPNKGDN